MSRICRRVRWAAIAALAVFFGLGPGCSRRPVTETTFTVGVLLPLSGGAASLGKPCLNGIQLRVDQYARERKRGEPVVQLIIEDTQAQPASAVSAFHKLVSAHNARAVLGPLSSGETLAVAPLADRNHVVILSPGASAPSVSTAGDYVFRNELSDAHGAREQARLAYDLLHLRTIGIIYVNNEYGVGTATVFRKQFTRLGGRVVVDEAFAAGTTDFRTALTAVKAAKPDAVLFVYQDDIVNFVRPRAELGVAAKVFTTPVFETPSNLKSLGSLAEGIVYAYYGEFDLRARNGAVQSFTRAYRNRFGGPPTYYSALGYDAASIMIEALRRCRFDPERLKASLYSIRGFRGVTGTTSFDKNGDVQKPVTIRTVRGGRFVPY